MKGLYDRIRGVVKEKDVWEKAELRDKIMKVRIHHEDYPEILRELRKAGEIELLNKKVRVKL